MAAKGLVKVPIGLTTELQHLKFTVPLGHLSTTPTRHSNNALMTSKSLLTNFSSLKVVVMYFEHSVKFLKLHPYYVAGFALFGDCLFFRRINVGVVMRKVISSQSQFGPEADNFHPSGL